MSSRGWVSKNNYIRYYLLAFFVVLSTISQTVIFSIPVSALSVEQAQACFDKYNGKSSTPVLEREKPNRIGPDYDFYPNGCDAVCTFTDNSTGPVSRGSTTCSQEKIDALKQSEKQAAKTDPTDAKNTAIAAAYAAKINPKTLGCGSTSANTENPTAVADAEVQKECAANVTTYIKECIVSDATMTSDTTKLSACIAKKYGKTDRTTKNNLKDVLDGTKDAALKAGAVAENDAKNQNACIDKDGTWENGTCTEKGSESKTTCHSDIGAVGWMVCPIMQYMAKIADGSYTFISDHFLSFESILLKDSDTLTAWKNFRNLANICFVLVFMVIIYSQITGAGINNYGIKRMLPRLVVAAILVNISFYLCAVAVDASNIAGYGIDGLFSSIPTASAGNPVGLSAGQTVIKWTAVVGVILASGTAILLAFSTPVILATLLSVLMIVLILVARKALILILIVVSPLAFVAYLLPNTEQWFKKWYKLFTSLLILFPVIGVVFSGSKLAARILANAPGAGTGTTDGILLQLTALGVASIPFFTVPSLLKGSLAAAGTLGAKLQGLSNAADKKVGARLKDSTKLGTGLSAMKAYRNQQRSIKFAKSRGRGVIGLIGRTPVIGGGKGYIEHARNRANDLEIKERNENIKAFYDNMAGKSSDNLVDIANDSSKSTEERAAAMQRVFQTGGYGDKQKILHAASKGDYFKGEHNGWARDMLASEYAKSPLSNAYGSKVAGTLTSGAAFDPTSEILSSAGDLTGAKIASHSGVAENVSMAYENGNETQKAQIREAITQLSNTPSQMANLSPKAIDSLRKIDPNFASDVDTQGTDNQSTGSSTNSSSTPITQTSSTQSATTSTPLISTATSSNSPQPSDPSVYSQYSTAKSSSQSPPPATETASSGEKQASSHGQTSSSTSAKTSSSTTFRGRDYNMTDSGLYIPRNPR